MDYSCYEGNSYLLGTMNWAVDHPDYNLWRWVLHESGFTKSIINDADLASLRRAYAKTEFSRGTKKLRELADIPGTISPNLIRIPVAEECRPSNEESTHIFELILQLPLLFSDPAFDYWELERLRQEIWDFFRDSGEGNVSPDTVHQTVECGSTIEYFIGTNAPQAVFEKCKPLLAAANKLGSVIAAYRRFDEDSFAVIWPTEYSAVFKPEHQSDQHRRTSRST